jgi:hypothetical protein
MNVRLGMALASCLGLWASVGVGCGSSSDGSASSGTTITSPEQMLTETAIAGCALQSRCFGRLAEVSLHGEDCVSHATKLAQDGELGVLVKLAGEGKVAFDGGKATRCVAAFANGSCDGSDLPSECDSVFLGSAKTGDACAMHEECGLAARCAGNTCPGTCTPRSAVGGPCADDADCVKEATCYRPESKCEARLQSGEACTGAVACVEGLSCVGLVLSEGKLGACGVPEQTPARRATLGEPCFTTPDGPFCVDDAVCELQTEPGPNAKFLCVAPYAAGGPCQRSIPDGCPLGEYCSVASGSVVPNCLPLPAEGKPCGRGPSGDVCGPGAACIVGACGTPGRLGEACNGLPTQCLSGKCSAQVCVPELDCDP